jgi:uncharacterized membrane protein YqjE
MNIPVEAGRAVLASLMRLVDTLLATVQARVELFATELQEEKCRFVHILLCAAVAAAFGIMTLTLATFTLVAIFWENENSRLTVLACLSLAYLAVTALAWRALQTRLKDRTAFSGTLGELKKDRSCFKPEN